MMRALIFLLLCGCSFVEAGILSAPVDWQMPVLGAERPVMWIIESPDTIAADAVALQLPANTKAYARFGPTIGVHYRCEIHTPPLNDVTVMFLIRHEVAHCVTGRFHE